MLHLFTYISQYVASLLTYSPLLVAPNTPIASAKRPRFAKKDMQSPLRNTAAISSLTVGGGAELKHKSSSSASDSGAEKKCFKGLFSPTGTSSAAGDEEDAGLNTIYTGVSMGGGQGGVSTPKRTSSGTLRQSSDNYAKADIYKASEVDGSGSSETDAQQALAAGGGGETSAAAAAEDEDDGDVFNPYQFISGLPPLDSIDRNAASLAPPTDASKPTLVLDLDETLVHCTVVPIPNPDLTFPVTFNGVLYDVYVRKRPYLDYFLEVVSRSFEVVVRTELAGPVVCCPAACCVYCVFGVLCAYLANLAYLSHPAFPFVWANHRSSPPRNACTPTCCWTC